MAARIKVDKAQLALELFEKPKQRTPFDCSDEGAVSDIGGGKSFCVPWDRWTNCREVGHCVYYDAVVLCKLH